MDGIDKIYEGLSSEFDLGTPEEFRTKIIDETHRRKLYDAVSPLYDLGVDDYDAFSAKVDSYIHKERKLNDGTTSVTGPVMTGMVLLHDNEKASLSEVGKKNLQLFNTKLAESNKLLDDIYSTIQELYPGTSRDEAYKHLKQEDGFGFNQFAKPSVIDNYIAKKGYAVGSKEAEVIKAQLEEAYRIQKANAILSGKEAPSSVIGRRYTLDDVQSGIINPLEYNESLTSTSPFKFTDEYYNLATNAAQEYTKQHPHQKPDYGNFFSRSLAAIESGLGNVATGIGRFFDWAVSDMIIDDPYAFQGSGTTYIKLASYEEKRQAADKYNKWKKEVDKLPYSERKKAVMPEDVEEAFRLSIIMRGLDEVEDWTNKKKEEANVTDEGYWALIKQGRIGTLLYQGWIDALNSAPQMLMGSHLSGRVVLGLYSAANEYDRLVKELPEMSTAERIACAAATGTLEQFFESRWNPIKFKAAKKAMPNSARGFIRDYSKKNFKDIAKSAKGFGKEVLKDMTEEGLEEVLTSTTTDIFYTLTDALDGNITNGAGLVSRYYEEKEKAEKEGRSFDAWDFCADVAVGYFNDFAGGALAGGYMGGVSKAIGQASSIGSKPQVSDGNGGYREMTKEEVNQMVEKAEALKAAVKTVSDVTEKTIDEVLDEIDYEQSENGEKKERPLSEAAAVLTKMYNEAIAKKNAKKKGQPEQKKSEPASPESFAEKFPDINTEFENQSTEDGVVRFNTIEEYVADQVKAWTELKNNPNENIPEQDVDANIKKYTDALNFLKGTPAKEEKKATKKTEVKKENMNKKPFTINVNGQSMNVTVTGKVVFNEDGSINREQSNTVYFKDENGNNITGQENHDAMLDALDDALREEKEKVQQPEVKDTPVAPVVDTPVAEESSEAPVVEESVDNRTPEQKAADDAAAAEQAERQRQDEIFSEMSALVEKDGPDALRKVKSPEKRFVYIMRKYGIDEAVKHAKNMIKKAESDTDLLVGMETKNAWQALIDKYAPQEQKGAPAPETPQVETPATETPVQENVEEPVVETPSTEAQVETPAEPAAVETPVDEGPAQEETTYEPVDLTADDIVLMRDSHSAYVPCRKTDDGKIIRLDNGKEVKGKTWEQVDKRVVKIGDKSYFILEKLSKEQLRYYNKKGGMVKVQPVDNGPQVDMPIADMTWENGDKVFIPNEDRKDKDIKDFETLLKTATDINQVLDYPLFSYFDKDQKEVTITLRDFIETGYSETLRDEKGKTVSMEKAREKEKKGETITTVREWDGKNLLNKVVEKAMNAIGPHAESSVIRNEIKKRYQEAVLIWNAIVKRENLNVRVEKNESDFVKDARNSVLTDGKVDLALPILQSLDDLNKAHNPLERIRDGKRAIETLLSAEQNQGKVTETSGKRKATEEDINHLIELQQRLSDENLLPEEIDEITKEAQKLRSEVDFGVPEQQQETPAKEQPAQTPEQPVQPAQEAAQEPAPAEPAQTPEPEPAPAAPLGETITEEVPAPEKRRGRNKKAQTEQTPMDKLKAMLDEVNDMKRRMQLGDSSITPAAISEKMNAINDFISENGDTTEMWNLLMEMQVGDEMELTGQGRRTAEREVDILREAGVDVDIISEEQLPDIIGEKKMQELRDSNGVVYGMSNGKKIWIVQERMNPNTPVHELGHLWVASYSQSHPEEWNDAIELLKKTEMWQTVLQDERYNDIHGDDAAMASEVFSRLLGAYYGATDAFGNTRFEDSFEKKGIMARVSALIRKVLRSVFKGFGYKLSSKSSDFDTEVRNLLSKPISEVAQMKTDIEQINNNFNNELQMQIDGSLPLNHVYQLGMPNSILRNAGIQNLPMELVAGRLYEKSNNKKHPFDIRDIKSLPQAIQNPIAIFDSRNEDDGSHTKDGKVILTELKSGKYNFIVVLRVRESNTKGGIEVEVNDVRSLYPKNSVLGIARWINDDLLLYANKEKLTDLITQSTDLIGGDEVGRELLNSAAKIVKKFHNAKFSDKNRSEKLELSLKTGDTLTEEEKSIKEQAEKDGTFMQAPDGTPTSLTEKQWCQVRTEAFKKWAGNSLVLNEHGEPKILYRGSKNPNSYVFHSKYQSGALWFTDDIYVAQSYARINADHLLSKEELEERVQPVFLRMDNVETFDAKGRTFENSVENPVYIVEDESTGDNLFFKTLEEAEKFCQDNSIDPDEIYASTSSGDVADAALENGKDGVIFTNMKDGYSFDGKDAPSTIYVVKDGTQAKSATENNGEFDENNPDIRFQIGDAEVLEDQQEPVQPAKRMNWLQRKANAVLDQANGIRLLIKHIGQIEGKKVSATEDVRDALEAKQSKITNTLNRFGKHQRRNLKKSLKGVQKKVSETGLWKKGMTDTYVDPKTKLESPRKLTKLNVIEMYLMAKDTIERMSKDRPVRAYELTYRLLQHLGMPVTTDIKTKEQQKAVLQAWVEKFESEIGKEQIDEMWSAVNGCTNFILDKLKDGGLIGETEYNELKENHFYVPERGFAQLESNEEVQELVQFNNRTKKKGITPEAMKKAEGGTSMATDVIANILHLATNAVACAEENKVRQAAFNLLKNHTDACRKLGYPAAEKVWFVRDGFNEDGSPRYTASLEKPSAEIIAQNEEVLDRIKRFKEDLELFSDDKAMQDFINEKINEAKKELLIVPKKDARDSAVSRATLAGETMPKVLVSVPTEDGGVEQYTMVFPNQPEIANALNGVISTKYTNQLIKEIGRRFSSLFTTYNPLFWSRNLPRDVLFVLQKGTAERGAAYGAFFAAEMARPATTILPIIEYVMNLDVDGRKSGSKFAVDGAIEKEFYKFMEGGGNTGFTQIKDIEQFRKEVDKLMQSKNFAGVTLDFLFKEIPSALNEFSELWTRFAVYRATKAFLAMENKTINALGRSVSDLKRTTPYTEEEIEAMALHDARNFSTNFNRRGAGGFVDFFNSISMFANASIQGAMGTYRSFEQGEWQKGIRGAAALMVIPALLGYLLTQLTPDDDDEESWIPDYIRQNYLVFMDKKIPLSYELLPWYRIGVNYALMEQGRISKIDGIENIATGFAEHSLPMPPSMSKSLKEMTDMAIPETDFSAKNPSLWSPIVPLLIGEFANPFIELEHGKNWLGNNLRYEYAKDKPQWMYQDYESEMYKDISKILYQFLGKGDMDNPSITVNGEKMNGIEDASPKEIKNFIGSITPNGWVKIATSSWGLSKGNVRDQDVPLKSDFTISKDKEMGRIGIVSEMNAMIREAKENYTRVPGLRGMDEKDAKLRIKQWDRLKKEYNEVRTGEVDKSKLHNYRNTLERTYKIRIDGETKEDLLHAYIILMTYEEIEMKDLHRTIGDLERWRAKYGDTPTYGIDRKK